MRPWQLRRNARGGSSYPAGVSSVADHLKQMTAPVRATVSAARRAVRAAAPKASEHPYESKPPRSKSALWKIARYSLGDADVAGIGASSTHVLLYFYRGTELDDGSGLLEGGGKTMRSIRLDTPREASRPEVKRMLRKAFELTSQPKLDPAIDEYLAGVSPKSRALLQKLRKTIRALVPEVEECISYRIPAFRYQGRIVAGFSATSSGCSYYPFSGTTLATLATDIAGYSHTKSALHFGSDTPLPTSLVRKLLAARMAEGKRRR
jgi:uncharacterized protein YdhG (YjbR/CyaY superfamily)